MPRELHPDLRACLERANPNVRIMVEMSAPDTEKVLRRASDQFFTTPPMVSISPALALAASASGSLQLAATPTSIASQATQSTNVLLDPRDDPAKKLLALRWIPATNFPESILNEFSATFQRVLPPGSPPFTIDSILPRFELQIYRAIAKPLWRNRIENGIPKPERIFTLWSFAPLLSTPAIVLPDAVSWASNVATVTWVLQNEGVSLSARGYRGPDVYPAPKEANGEKAAYYFAVKSSFPIAGVIQWRSDSGPESVTNVGDFETIEWQRPKGTDDEEWKEALASPRLCGTFDLKVERYNPAGGQAEAIYAIDLGRTPSPLAFGRTVFERSEPEDSAVAMDLSTAGASGPWTPVSHDSDLSTVQQNYHLRLTFTPSTGLTATPSVHAFGVAFREPFDVSPETKVQPLSADASAPFLQSSIGEGRLRLLRTGRRDFLDRATWFGANVSPPKVEVDIYLGSDHPNVPRAKWLLLDRAMVSNRVPFETAEEFTLLSIAQRLKRKMPGAVETINSVHKVVSHAGTAVTVSPQLVGVTALGNEYDGQNYIMRVRRSANPDVPTGWQAGIAGNTGINVLNLVDNSMPGLLVADDEVEVHSAIMQVNPIEWFEEDPADIWFEILTEHAGIPEERIGINLAGRAGRSGLPPTIGDIEFTEPDLRKVTCKIDKEAEVKELVDQLSFIMGGITTVIAGQICFVQVYPLADSSGVVTVRAQPTNKIFDPRDFYNLSIPPGLEQRSTFCTCTYGVDLTAKQASPARITSFVDSNALAWLTQQDLELVGANSIPDEIARWCFNSLDHGRYLAGELARQVVHAASTGLRVATWHTVAMHPELQQGDTVVLSTDIYTDYDPSTEKPIFGWRAIRAVILGVSPDRRQFRGYIIGLHEIFDDIGGRVGARVLKRPKAPIIQSILFDSFGVMRVKAKAADDDTAAMRLGWSYVSQVEANTMAETAGIAPEEDEGPSETGAHTFFAEDLPDGFTEDEVIFVSIMPFALPEATAPGQPAEAEVVRSSEYLLPTVAEIFGLETADTAKLYIKILEDPQLRVTSVDYQTRVGAGDPSAFVAASLVTLPGGLGESGQAYEMDVDLIEKHISTITYRVHGKNENNEDAVLIRAMVPFQAGRNPGIPTIYPTIHDDGQLDITLQGDSDAKSSLLAVSLVDIADAKTLAGTRLDGRVTNFVNVGGGALTPGTTIYIVARSYSLTIAEESGGGVPAISEWAERILVIPALQDQGQCEISIVSEDKDSVTVEVDGAPDSVGGREVALIAIEGATTKLAGDNVGVVVAAPAQWTFSRAAIDVDGTSPGNGRVRFRALVPGYRPDDDYFTVVAQGRDTVRLEIRTLKVVPSVFSGAPYDLFVFVADPFPQPGVNVNLEVWFSEIDLRDNFGNPITVQGSSFSIPAASITNDIDTTGFLTFSVMPNPATERKHGRVVFTARASGRVSDSDVVDLAPEIERTPPQVTLTGNVEGQVRASVIGDSAVASYKWLASTSSMPDAATVASTGTLHNGNVMFLNPAITIGPGQTAYVAILPYYFTGAAGTPGVLVQAELDWSDTQAGPAVFLDYDNAGSMSARVSGSNTTLSFKYKASKVGMPSDADVRAETAVNGSSLNLTALLTLALLEVGFFKVFAYTEAGGTGQESPATSAQIMRVDTISAPGIVLSDPDEGGDVAIAISGLSSTQSLKFATSTSDYPSVATVQGTSAINASHHEAVIDSNLDLGQSLFATALAYSGASGAGDESPPARAKVTRQNKATLKSINVPASGFANSDPLFPVNVGGGGAYIEVPIGEAGGATYSLTGAIPQGATITEFYVLSYIETPGSDQFVVGSILKLDGAGGHSLIAHISRNSGSGGWLQTSDVAIDEEVDGEYLIQLGLENVTGTQTNTVKVASAIVFFTVPDLSK